MIARVARIVAVVALLGMAPRAYGGLSTTAASAQSPAVGGAQVVTLITGDHVAVSTLPDGRPNVTVMPATRDGTAVSFQTITANGHVYVIPQDAAGYIGSPLDLGLFDVTGLVAMGYAGSSAALPLDITYDSTTTQQSLPPGLTRTGGNTVREDQAQAGRFGKALSDDWWANKSGQGSHLFDGITRIALAGSSPRSTISIPPGQPSGQLYTLTVKGFDRLGHRVRGDLGVVFNADNGNTFLAGQSFFNGSFAYSVPAGTYQVHAFITTGYSQGSYDIALVELPEVTVKSNTVVILDARKGNRIGAQVPDPTSQVAAVVTLQRDAVQGPGFAASLITPGSAPIYATPTDQVHVGGLHFYPYLRLGDAGGLMDRYLYDLEFSYTGSIPVNLNPTISSAQLARIDTAYHSSVPGRPEYEGRTAVAPWQLSSDGIVTSLAAPISRTEYVLPQPDFVWQQQVILGAADFSGITNDIWRTYAPGDHLTADWNGGPQPPGIDQETLLPEPCPACRSGDTLSLFLWPFVDNEGHWQMPDGSVNQDLSLYEDGALVGETNGGLAGFPMSPNPANYRLVYDVHRQAPWWSTSTDTHTEWSFASQERPGDTLPAGWTCGKGGLPPIGTDRGGGGGGGGGSSCSFEPLLFLDYGIHAGLDDVVPAGGVATIDFTVHHQAHAPQTPIAGLALSVSFDDGASWTPVGNVTDLGGGQFRASYPQPNLDGSTGYASLRVSASDSAGSRIDQTITRAYPLVVSPPVSLTPSPGGQPVRACSSLAAPPFAQCAALVSPNAGTDARGIPSGYGPDDIRSAYRLPSEAGSGMTVAVVDAYDDPNAEADLAVYRDHYGLSPCTTANGCFRKVNQQGQAAPLPSPDPGWGIEVSLDLDAVSAACPRCKILLVEGNSPSLFDLSVAANTAVSLGANVVSNSYSSLGEFSGETYFDRFYKHPGVAITASTGDYGYGNGAILIGGVGYPAVSEFVTAVGGTSLTRSNNARGWQESAWIGATSGCSAYVHKPGWQHDNLCSKRTVADVSAVADPYTGLAVYDSYGYDGWLVVGGTSASAPIVAGVYALTGDTSHVRYGSGPYGVTAGLFDVVGGSNGDCGGTYLCTGVQGYDGPTGLGSPNGISAFQGS